MLSRLQSPLERWKPVLDGCKEESEGGRGRRDESHSSLAAFLAPSLTCRGGEGRRRTGIRGAQRWRSWGLWNTEPKRRGSRKVSDATSEDTDIQRQGSGKLTLSYETAKKAVPRLWEDYRSVPVSHTLAPKILDVQRC